MKTLILSAIAILLWGCATMMQMHSPRVSILVDLDPARADRSVIVESITAAQQGRLYLPDRVTGNILRVDPKSPKAVVVGKIEDRKTDGKPVSAEGGGIAFNSQGDLFIASRPFKEVVRIKKADLNPERPGLAQTFARQMEPMGLSSTERATSSSRATDSEESIAWAPTAVRLRLWLRLNLTRGHFLMEKRSSR